MLKQLIFILFSVFLFSSCIEITQKVQFKKNGSGTVAFSVDFSKVKALLGNELPEGNDGPRFKKESEDLKKIDGISKVQTKKKDGIETMTFTFKNVNALNRAMESIWKNNSKKPVFVINNDSWEFNPIELGSFDDFMNGKKNNATDNEVEGGGDVVEDYSNGLKSKENDELKNNFDMIKTMFGEPKINFEIHFPQTLLSVSDDQAQILEKGKKLIRSYSIFGLDDKKSQQPMILKFK